MWNLAEAAPARSKSDAPRALNDQACEQLHAEVIHKHLAPGSKLRIELLPEAKVSLEAAGMPIEGMFDHWISYSLHPQDPDGNQIELYVDVPDYYCNKRQEWQVNPVGPLQFDEPGTDRD